ncbi:type-2 ice-structuring protein-like [Acanthochromis polyacanthus]|uniref:type-2 ice-structuring protein-like n=1 Tax=Acanthochromis polyacanthus TaxID=80966 RepID=UPI00223486CD|nr:type-2 ice-structuring protein-like [Acanthochromis polyacanthus]
MKTLSVCLLLCAVTTLTRAADVQEAAVENNQLAESHLVKRSVYCSGGWSAFNGRCFRYIPTPMTWAQAEKNCQALGGNLASVHDYREHLKLQRVIRDATYSYRKTWIGGSDAQQENVFFWSDGTPFRYTSWCPGEPNNHLAPQHCIQMNFGNTKCWDDLQCSYRRPSVCAKRIR